MPLRGRLDGRHRTEQHSRIIDMCPRPGWRSLPLFPEPFQYRSESSLKSHCSRRCRWTPTIPRTHTMAVAFTAAAAVAFTVASIFVVIVSMVTPSCGFFRSVWKERIGCFARVPLEFPARRRERPHREPGKEIVRNGSHPGRRPSPSRSRDASRTVMTIITSRRFASFRNLCDFPEKSRINADFPVGLRVLAASSSGFPSGFLRVWRRICEPFPKHEIGAGVRK